MTTFDERERGFEAKFAHDADFRFRLAARRDKLFAHWAAARLHLRGAEEEALVASVLHVADGPGHDTALLAHIARAMAGDGPAPAPPELAAALAACAQQARAQLLGLSSLGTEAS